MHTGFLPRHVTVATCTGVVGDLVGERFSMTKLQYSKIYVTTALAAFALTGCATTENAPWAELGKSENAQLPPLNPGDKLTITVFDEPSLSGSFTIAGNGQVSMPLIGPVAAHGLTVDQFRRRLTRRLADGYLNNPKVTVEVANHRPIFVHGEVRNGGEFSYKPGLSFRDAIATAGGYTYRAEESYLLLTRRGAKSPVRIALPTGGIVQPGDNIRIPERFF